MKVASRRPWRGWRPWRPKTLRGRLTLWMVGILLVTFAVLGVTTVLFLRSFLVSRLDEQLAQAGGRYSASLEHGQNNPGGNDGDADNAVPGQSTGTIGVRLVDGQVKQAAIVTPKGKNRAVFFGAGDVAELRELAVGGHPRSLKLDAVGAYRLQAVAGRDGDVQITGLPLHQVSDTLAELVLVEGTLFAVILVAGGAVSAIVVRRTMRPLAHLTQTALEVSELPLADPDIELPRTVLPTEPSTEVDQMAVAFNHMLEHLRRSLADRDATERRLRQFIADASHELRTPLATIRANAEFAARPDAGGNPQARAEALGRISTATERMGKLVADLLLLARLDAGRPLERQQVDLTRLVLDAVSDARTAYPDHHWRLELSGDIVTVTGDAERLYQVLANLVSNAGMHTPPGTTVTAALSWDPADAGATESQVEVSVRDDGPGISPAQQAELFDRFSRGDSSRSRSHGSTGLGLAIARGITLAHEGELTVSDSSEGGACFVLRLPVDPQAERQGERTVAEPAGLE